MWNKHKREGETFIDGSGLRTYTPKERNMYLAGMVGQNIIYSVIGASLAYYLQFTILIPAIAGRRMTATAIAGKSIRGEPVPSRASG